MKYEVRDKKLLEAYLHDELKMNYKSIGNLTDDQLAMFITYDGMNKEETVTVYWEIFCIENGINPEDVADDTEAEEIDAQYKFFWDNAHEVYDHTKDGVELLGTVIDLR